MEGIQNRYILKQSKRDSKLSIVYIFFQSIFVIFDQSKIYFIFFRDLFRNGKYLTP
jgi:hypothetical protein